MVQQSVSISYRVFFEQLLEDLRRHSPTVSWNTSPSGRNWEVFTRVKGQTWYGVGFTHPNLLRVDLHVRDVSFERTQALFYALHDRRNEIETALDKPLNWEPPQPGRQAGRLALYRHGSIENNPRDLCELKSWAADGIFALHDASFSHINELIRSQPIPTDF